MFAACAQLQAQTIDQAAAVWPAAEALVEQARLHRVDLLVFPEITYPAYWLDSADRYRRPDIERSYRVLQRFSSYAARAGAWIVAGFVEEHENRLFNSAAVFDRRGRSIGIARKCFLWDCDHRWFAPGDSPRVCKTEFGPMGVLICADARVPEIPATLISLGAKFIVQPTAWVNTSTVPGKLRNIQPEFLIPSRAKEFRVPFICSSKSGREADQLEYVGLSRIVSATGETLAAAPPDGDALITAPIHPSDATALPLTDTHRRRLLDPRPPSVSTSPTPRCTIDPSAAVAALASQLNQADVRVARLSTAELNTFAPARCAALDGAQIILAEGPAIDPDHARTRAAENRVFLIAGSAHLDLIIDPAGCILFRAGDSPASIELDPSQADVKRFTPTTDLWTQRRPASYRLDPPAPVDARRTAS